MEGDDLAAVGVTSSLGKQVERLASLAVGAGLADWFVRP
jgi:hypothetical protein